MRNESGAGESPEGAPNILLITTDQQRYDSCGPMQRPGIATPHFDMLARQGVVFSRAYSNCPLCVPTRISIMSGLYAQTHGMIGNGSSSSVMGYEETIPGYLRRHGYQTCAVGKMHWDPPRVRHGFDEMIILQDYYDEMARISPMVQPMGSGLDQNELYPALSTVPEGLSITNWIAEQSSRFIRERRDPTRPFFLWCSFSKPHPPLDPPEPYFSMYRNQDIGTAARASWSEPGCAPLPFERARQTWSADRIPDTVLARAREAYYGLITQIDYNMGKLIAALNETKLFDDTLIIYTSDHGEMLGDHRAMSKMFAYEGSSHVPFLVRLPRTWDPQRVGEIDDALVTHADILPTIVEAATGTCPTDVDGISLLGVVEGNPNCASRRFLEIVCSGWEGVAPGGDPSVPVSLAATDGRYKYIWYPEGAREQLFDVQDDPEERRDLVTDPDSVSTDTLSRLRNELVRALKNRESPWVHDDGLVTIPTGTDTEAERRARRLPTFSSIFTPNDTRH